MKKSKPKVDSALAKQIIKLHDDGASYTDIIITTKLSVYRITRVLKAYKLLINDDQRKFYFALLDACVESGMYVQAESILRALLQAGYLYDDKSIKKLEMMSNSKILTFHRIGTTSLPIIRFAIDIYNGTSK